MGGPRRPAHNPLPGPGRATGTRMPVEPLLNIRGIAELAAMIGCAEHTVHTWIQDGIPWPTADVIAIRIGVHPVDVWPDWFDIAIQDSTRLCGTPSGRRQHYHAGTPVCDDCREAENRYQRERKRKVRLARLELIG